MSEFDFEELIADMLNITDDQRNNEPDQIADSLYSHFDIEYDVAYKFTKALLNHTPKVQAGLSGKEYHAFVSKDQPIMLMKKEVKQ